MKYDEHKNIVLKHIVKFNRGLQGVYRGKKYGHILYINPDQSKIKIKNDKYDVIRKYSLLECNKKFPIENISLHQYAHHLNSSQIMCFNFFGPQTSDGYKCKKALIDLISNILHIDSKNAECEFEKVFHDNDWKWNNNGKTLDEGTNFDFYIKAENAEIFFEIKYTEYGFGKVKKEDEDKIQNKSNQLYNNKIKKCIAIKDKERINFDFIKAHYQLIRNIVRIQKENQYVLFITDHNNPATKNEWDKVKEIFDEKHVLFIDWREICDRALQNGFGEEHISEFKARYLDYNDHSSHQ